MLDSSVNKIFYQITAVRSHPSRVRRLAHEKELIQKLKPSWNVQVEFLWWNNRSNEFKERECEQKQQSSTEQSEQREHTSLDSD